MDHGFDEFPHFQKNVTAPDTLVATIAVLTSGCILLVVLCACHRVEINEAVRIAAAKLKRKSPFEKVI